MYKLSSQDHSKKLKTLIATVIFFCTISATSMLAQYIANEEEGDYYIRNISIKRDSVFMHKDKDWFFAANAANAIHSLTRKYIIEDEILFTAEKITTEEILQETERNLRNMGLFTTVKIELDSVAEGTYDAYIITKDRWSLYPEPLFGSSGGDISAGGRISEFNLAGTGTSITAEALYRQENDIQWQGQIILEQARLFRSEIGLTVDVMANRFRTEQVFNLEKKYRTLSTPSSYGISVTNNFGDRFKYTGGGNYDKLNTTERRASIFYSHGWERQNRYFTTIFLEFEDTKRPSEEYARAFDNCGKFLVQFSSTFHDYYKVSRLNTYLEEDIERGGYGRVIVGRTFPMKQATETEPAKGESMYYVAGEGEQSYYKNNLYIFGGIKGASGFMNGYAKYTYEEINFKTFYQFNDFLTIGASLRQQTVWNWHSDRQLILDSETGLRGYEANIYKGDNRIVSNVEVRMFPDWRLWVFDFSAVAFWDIGTVWQETIKIAKAQWHNSVGIGFRSHFSKSSSPLHTSRLDIAYNFDEQAIGSIMFSAQQYITLFQKHDYRKPNVFGLEYDE